MKIRFARTKRDETEILRLGEELLVEFALSSKDISISRSLSPEKENFYDEKISLDEKLALFLVLYKYFNKIKNDPAKLCSVLYKKKKKKNFNLKKSFALLSEKKTHSS